MHSSNPTLWSAFRVYFNECLHSHDLNMCIYTVYIPVHRESASTRRSKLRSSWLTMAIIFLCRVWSVKHHNIVMFFNHKTTVIIWTSLATKPTQRYHIFHITTTTNTTLACIANSSHHQSNLEILLEPSVKDHHTHKC